VTRKLRVAQMIDTLGVTGGAEALVSQIAPRIDRARFEPQVIVTRPWLGPYADPIEEAGVPIWVLPRSSRWQWWEWARLARYLRRERIDVLHAHMFGSNFWGSLVGTAARVPVVISHEHTWSYEGRRWRKLADKHVIARFSDVFLAVSRDDRRKMEEIEGIDPAHTEYVPLGIPPLAPSATDVRAELDLPPGAPVVGTVCGLRPQKALEVLVEAAGVLHREFPGLVVVVAGDGPEEEPLRRLVAARGLADVVRLIGRWPSDRLPELLASFDVAVNTSDFEGSPLAVMEFMACEKAIVATSVGGTPDLIEDGVHGLLVPPRDAQALARATAGLLRDPGLRERLGTAARERQVREFEIDGMVRRLEELYERLYARATGAAPA
jgi:glycosyltransferase involved in cell wall biosynthesis